MVLLGAELRDVKEVWEAGGLRVRADVDFALELGDGYGWEDDGDVVGGGVGGFFLRLRFALVASWAPQRGDVRLRPGGVGHDDVDAGSHVRVGGGEQLPVPAFERAFEASSCAGVDAVA